MRVLAVIRPRARALTWITRRTAGAVLCTCGPLYAVICLDCGLENPPPRPTCMRPGAPFPVHHYVGVHAGCRYCGRMKEVCAMEPCKTLLACA